MPAENLKEPGKIKFFLTFSSQMHVFYIDFRRTIGVCVCVGGGDIENVDFFGTSFLLGFLGRYVSGLVIQKHKNVKILQNLYNIKI